VVVVQRDLDVCAVVVRDGPALPALARHDSLVEFVERRRTVVVNEVLEGELTTPVSQQAEESLRREPLSLHPRSPSARRTTLCAVTCSPRA
jgi:hypothetical protein